jgi:gliding motility-associated-like protein
VVVANPLAPTCFNVDTATIGILMMPNLGSDTSVCIDDSLTLIAGVTSTGTTYLWNTGATTQSIIVNGTSTGTYSVVINNGTCIFSDSIIVTNKALTTNAALIPNVFTPNGDGMNEFFKLPGYYSEFSLKIYNRWGALIYETISNQQPWDGKHKGKDAADGTYYFIVTYRDECATESITDHGFVHVMR